MADESSCLSPDLFDNEENSSMSVEEKNVAAPGGGGGSSPKKNAGDGEEEKVESPTTSKAKSAAATEKEAAEFDLSDGDDDDDDDDDTEFEANALRIVEDADEEEEEDDEESDEEIDGKKSVNVPASNGSSSSRKNVQHKSSEKRKVDEADWSSEDDEEAFAGFGDTSGEFSSRGATHLLQGHENKKIKTEIADSPIKKEIKEEKISPETVMKEEKLEKDEGAAPNIPSPLPAAENPHPQPMATSTPGNNLTPPFNKKGKILPPSDPIYRVPFEYGWKRELVLRAIPEVSKEKGEVYYITPTGKKLRTRNEIYNHLPKDGTLTMNHFTFSKESLGVSAEFEVIRSAKLSSSTIRRTNFDMSNDMSLTTMGKRVPKPKVPKGASPPPTNRLALKTGRNPTGIRDSKDGKISEDVSGKTSKSKKLQGDNRHSHNRRGGINADSRKAPTDQENLSPPSSTIKLNNNISSSAVVKSRVSDNLGNNSFEMMDCSGGSMSEASSSHFSKQFFSNVSVGYYVLLHTFQYLKVQELLRAACVCRLWNQAANHTNLWRTVRMKNSQVNDWKGLAATLINNGARHLDLRKMLSPSNITTEESWTQFSKIIGTIKNLESIDLCKCSTTIVEHLFESNSNLRVLNALTLKDDVLNLEKVSNLKNLVELRLKSSEGLIVDDITPLSELKSIKHLSLTSIKELGTKNIEVLGELTSLESLELGECTEFNNSFVENVLTCLTSLQRLRLEKGQNNCSSFEILAGIAKMENLIQLELINFDVRTEFDDYISKCTNIKKLLIIPTYVSQSATTNQIVLNGVMQLSPTLQSFTWAVTGELVRVTELYVDNCDANKRSKKSLSDCIPVLKPVPGILDSTQIMSKRVAADVPQVEILPLTSVEKILITAMPTTSVHMVIIPYHGTWRQNLVEN